VLGVVVRAGAHHDIVPPSTVGSNDEKVTIPAISRRVPGGWARPGSARLG
jgi:hypothetical protein